MGKGGLQIMFYCFTENKSVIVHKLLMYHRKKNNHEWHTVTAITFILPSYLSYNSVSLTVVSNNMYYH